MGDREVIKLSAVSSSLPAGANEEVELPYGNSRAYVAGKITYESIPLILNDFVDKDTRAAVLRWHLHSRYAQALG